MRRVVWTPAAQFDLDDLQTYGGFRDPEAAERIAWRAAERADQLREVPFLGRPTGYGDTRRVTVPQTPYRLIYEVTDTEVRILRLGHGARDEREA